MRPNQGLQSDVVDAGLGRVYGLTLTLAEA